ncbi:MAG: LysE family transporter [Lewinella sp.]|nr:LysE family transporter [Lewinella sp.]
MYFLSQGIWLGLGLSVLTGPMFFLYLKVGVERGFRAGATAGLGAWISDLLYILVAYFAIQRLLTLVETPGFTFYTGLVGGCVLMVMGAATLWQSFQPAQPLPAKSAPRSRHSPKALSRLFLQGFAINAFNPFAIFFWLGVMTTASAGQGMLTGPQATALFGGILGTVILTDLLKVLLAKRIRIWVRPVYLLRLRQVAGAMFVLFGLVLMIRVF